MVCVTQDDKVQCPLLAQSGHQPPENARLMRSAYVRRMLRDLLPLSAMDVFHPS